VPSTPQTTFFITFLSPADAAAVSPGHAGRVPLFAFEFARANAEVKALVAATAPETLRRWANEVLGKTQRLCRIARGRCPVAQRHLGIESPGLASSLAIARHVAALLAT
jgi:hypothetical protein